MRITIKGPGDVKPRPYTASELLRLMVAHVADATDGSLVAAEGQTVYVGRQGGAQRARFGNPFSHLPRSTAPFKVSNRAEAVEKFAVWINEPSQAELLADVQASLHRKVLLCHCQHQSQGTPACHAEVLVRLANPDYALAAAEEAKRRPPQHLDLTYPTQFEAFVRDHGMASNPRVIVTGDRNWQAADVVTAVVREFGPGVVVIEGEARGVDEMARDAALEQLGVPVAGFPAQWDPKPSTPPSQIRTRSDGKRYVAGAGPMRNIAMLEAAGEKLERVYAFHDDIQRSRGTNHMVAIAWSRGVPIVLTASDGSQQTFTPAAPGTPLPPELTPLQESTPAP